MRLCVALALLCAGQAAAEVVVATRTIRPQQVITAQDVRMDPARREGAHTQLAAVVGKEARVAIYPGRVVMMGTLSAPALIERNQMVEIVFSRGGLRIVAEGRALGRGGAGDRIRVMNIASRTVLFGTVTDTGHINVSP